MGFTKKCQRMRLVTYHNGTDGNRVFGLKRASLEKGRIGRQLTLRAQLRKGEEADSVERRMYVDDEECYGLVLSCDCKALISVSAQRGNPGQGSAISKLSMLLLLPTTREGSMPNLELHALLFSRHRRTETT